MARISVRSRTLSALDAIADGPQAKAFGITRRLHDVAERYAALLSEASYPFCSTDLSRISDALAGVPLPGIGEPVTLRMVIVAAVTARFPLEKQLLGMLETLQLAQLVALVEAVEETQLRGA